MDEAGVTVEFQMPDGETAYRTFYLPVGPDDNYSSISNRLSEIVEDYVNGVAGQSDAPNGITPVIDPSGNLEYIIIDWPEFD